MFYSQFILAKKGPLGTIWIAAHLERKLRKNQVADTDIGVSVDSIMFPDVPIALRLSSHLLLGVVRIYSRKVNYLFDDCSEALLKIKQAFRSTAVDLPPEESTAPYHSITLPETFDLDDFELPDNEIFQGNYVDHHVSSREQITLQDTRDGVVFSTSQFGLDERFGDGDTSQIGLLDEELVLDRVEASGHAGVSVLDLQGSDVPQKQDPSNSEAVPMDCRGDQDPSSPGLVKVSKLSGDNEALAAGDHAEPEHDNLTELPDSKSAENASNKSNLPNGDNNPRDQSLQNELNHDAIVFMPPEKDCHIADMEKEQTKPQGSSLPDDVSVEYTSAVGTIRGPDGLDRVEDMHNGGMHSMDRTDRECAESPSCSNVTFDLDEPARKTCSCSTCVPASDDNLENEQASHKYESRNDAGTENNLEESSAKAISSNPSCPVESPNRPTIIDGEAQACQEPNVSKILKEPGIHEEVSSVQFLGSDNSTAAEQNSMDLSQREGEVHSIGASIEVQGQTQMLEPAFCGDQLENSNSCAMSDLPAPEKLLSAPAEPLDKPCDLLAESAPDKEFLAGNDEIDDGTKLISGKKRSITESTLTVESINSVESFGRLQSRRTAESVPDDDDFLSSILGGRRSSVFKMKPTPSFEVASLKRARASTKPSATKRKVLMDDTMVLYGDTIRQQLVNTEDIRRIRKKAPCTRPEISLILRQFLGDEIFSESILTGVSSNLAGLHNEPYDLSRIRICEGDEEHASNEVSKDSGALSDLIQLKKVELKGALCL
ncbi:Sister chromatid cohesion 1 protein 4 [Hibiscus syriacus]|uniref:Sister chromatid cohesion 1 protein 4 n=1 Tax=Hibiscus syriacus TaxID=106335 RepID=A0A6A3A5F6_HIBSY|nr:Sister chromatid cohesion 1 protein 4 [Hibiscus syriacus]